MCSFTMVARSQKTMSQKLFMSSQIKIIHGADKEIPLRYIYILCLASMIVFHSMIKTKIFLNASSKLG